MLTKCAACGSRILAGGESFANRRFCNDGCLTRFQAALTDEVVPPEDVDEQIRLTFRGPCPDCGREGGNDLYSATKVSAFLIFFQINSQKRLCCAGCGRKNRLLAALHCLALGWWGPRAAICNVFVLPANLIAAAFIRTPAEPSEELRQLVRARMAQTLVPQLLAARRAENDSAPDEDDS